MTAPEVKPAEGCFARLITRCCAGCAGGCLTTFLVCSALSVIGVTILPLNTAILAGIACSTGILLTGLLATATRKRITGRTVLFQSVVIVGVIVAFFVWDTPRYVFTCAFPTGDVGAFEVTHCEYNEHPFDPTGWVAIRGKPSALKALLLQNGYERSAVWVRTDLPSWLDEADLRKYDGYARAITQTTPWTNSYRRQLSQALVSLDEGVAHAKFRK